MLAYASAPSARGTRSPEPGAAANPRLAAAMRLFARVAVGYVVGVSLLVLAGWALNVEALKTFLHPGPVAMNPLTAVAFLLCGGSLGLQIGGAAGRRRGRHGWAGGRWGRWCSSWPCWY